MKRKKNVSMKIQAQKMTRAEIVTESIGVCLLISSLFSIPEIPEMDNNLFGGTLFLLCMVLGLIFGTLCYYTYFYRFSYSRNRNGSAGFFEGGLIFFLMLIPPSLLNYYNRTYPLSEAICGNYRILEKNKSWKGGTYWLHVSLKGSKEQLELDWESWNKYQEGDLAQLCIAKGGLGLEFVQEIK